MVIRFLYDTSTAQTIEPRGERKQSPFLLLELIDMVLLYNSEEPV